jgi:diadenosine tetraphosphate (Ap4A) HIT family hydrolase
MNCSCCTLPEIKDRKIVENDLAWAFLGNMPITPGHTLVIPNIKNLDVFQE